MAVKGRNVHEGRPASSSPSTSPGRPWRRPVTPWAMSFSRLLTRAAVCPRVRVAPVQRVAAQIRLASGASSSQVAPVLKGLTEQEQNFDKEFGAPSLALPLFPARPCPTSLGPLCSAFVYYIDKFYVCCCVRGGRAVLGLPPSPAPLALPWPPLPSLGLLSTQISCEFRCVCAPESDPPSPLTPAAIPGPEGDRGTERLERETRAKLRRVARHQARPLAPWLLVLAPLTATG